MPAITLPDYPYTSQLGWSSTRSETFRTCRRRYFFQYYARYDTELPLEHIQRLKGLSSIPMTVGEAVHDVLAVLLRRLLQSADPIDGDRFVCHVRQTLELALSGKELMEVHYGQRPMPRADDLFDSAMVCFEHLLSSERYNWLVAVLQRDPRYLIESPGYGEGRLQGMKIYAKVDCLVEADGQVVILDWKTGRQDPVKHSRQLLAYAAWAEDYLGVEAQQIRCLAVYLQNGYEEFVKHPTRTDLQGLAMEVMAEIQDMQSLLRDVERNIPLGKNNFPLTENRGYCRNCQFRKLCDRVEVSNG
jgi:CRISPR/Cas system-associated exonuclease Cas4 (RecB family)